jgi:hypothetical protein
MWMLEIDIDRYRRVETIVYEARIEARICFGGLEQWACLPYYGRQSRLHNRRAQVIVLFVVLRYSF